MPLAASIWLGLTIALSPQQSARPAVARAQTTEPLPPMSTDRPDITDSTDVVGHGFWQLETGVSFQTDLEGGASHHELTLPVAMLRFGVSDRLELRVNGDGVLTDRITEPDSGGRGTRVTGGSDLEVGAKWKLFERPRGGWLFALEPVLSLPVGSGDFTSGGYDPTLKIIADRDLPGGVAVSANVVVSWMTDSAQRFVQHAVSGSFARALGGAWYGYAEIYRASATTPRSGRAWIGDVGAMRTFGRRIQIDVSVGRGLTDAAPNWFVGAGIAVRGVPGG